MITKTQKQLVPQLRFADFEDNWSSTQIGKVLSIGSGRDYKHLNEGDIPVYGTGGLMSKVDDFLYEGESVCIGRKGTIDKPIYLNEKFWTVDTLFYTHKFIDCIPKFIYPIFQRINWYKYNEASGVPSLSKKTIEAIKINIPTLPEQQKIASFLSSVDTKLQQLTKKKELLEQYKKGVMQQLFSQQLRFKQPDGSDYPDWEEKRFDEVVLQKVREIPKPNINYLAIGIRSHAKGTFQKPNSDPSKNSMSKLFLVRENDLIVNITFAWEGAIAIVKKEDDGGLVSHRFPTYNFRKNQSNHEYFEHLIKDKRFRFTLDLISPGGAGRNRVLSKKEFLKIKWVFPSIEEQQQIANYLSALDTKIESVAQQITQTQQFKKGLLQQMFV